MAAEVYFASMRANMRTNLMAKVDALLKRMGLPEAFAPHHLVAIKTHFGEEGNAAFIRPIYIRQIAQLALKNGAHVFVTDTNTLYRGSREDAAMHLRTAHHHGFTYGTLGVPVMIADGLRARAGKMVAIQGRHYQQVPIAEAIAEVDGLIVATHFKLHEATGFGGAIKNLGMGCATREGKLAIHSSVAPHIEAKACRGDEICVKTCTFGAISMLDHKAVIDEKLCTGCAECLGVCPHEAIHVRWNSGMEELQEKLVEFAMGAVQGKADRCFYINFLMQVSPACDCYPMNDAPIIPDLGFFASRDPVALDAACVDALQQARGLENSILKSALAPGTDKIKDVYPSINYQHQLEYAERMGLGHRTYKLLPI